MTCGKGSNRSWRGNLGMSLSLVPDICKFVCVCECKVAVGVLTVHEAGFR